MDETKAHNVTGVFYTDDGYYRTLQYVFEDAEMAVRFSKHTSYQDLETVLYIPADEPEILVYHTQLTVNINGEIVKEENRTYSFFAFERDVDKKSTLDLLGRVVTMRTLQRFKNGGIAYSRAWARTEEEAKQLAINAIPDAVEKYQERVRSKKKRSKVEASGRQKME